MLLNTPGRGSRSPATTAGINVLRTRLQRIAAAGLLRVDEQRAPHVIHAAGAGTVLALLSASAQECDLGLPDAMFDAAAAAILTTTPATPDPTVSAVAVTFLTVLADLPALTNAERTLIAEWLTRSLSHLRAFRLSVSPPSAGPAATAGRRHARCDDPGMRLVLCR